MSTVLVGPGGHGKTYLAAALAAGLWRTGSSDLQAWIKVSSKLAVVLGYALAAQDLKLTGPGTPPEDAAAKFLDWLSRTDSRWLIILDAVGDIADVTEMWPQGPSGHVVLTCRPEVDLAQGSMADPNVYRIGAFSARESLHYLAARLTDDADQRIQAVDLAADLGYVPLALRLATAAMAGSGVSCREYRFRFASRQQELAGRAGPAWVSPAEVTWSLALDRADQRPPVGLARSVLALMALLDPAGAPVQVPASQASCEYLTRRSGGMPVDRQQALAAVRNLAQFGIVTVEAVAQVQLVTIHPAVHAAVRRLVPAAVLDDAAKAAADGLLEVWPPGEDDSVLAQALRECAAHLGQVAGNLLWQPAPHPLLFRAGTSRTSAGLTQAAMAYWRQLLDVSSRVLGADEAPTLEIRDLVARASEDAGLIDDAIELFRTSVSERQRIQGPDHPDTLSARAAIAKAYRAAGMHDAAIEEYERVVSDRQWILGARHPDTLATRSQLASTYHLAGQVEKAIVLYERNLPEWEGVFGPDHQDVLNEASNLGRAYQAAGRLADAITVFRRILAVRERTLGRDHPDTLTAYGQLAFAYRTAGRMKDAIPCYRQTLSGRESVLGPDHPDTLTALANLASCYHSAGRMKDAIPLYERLLADRERAQGPDHPNTLTARGNLAGAYHSAGRLAEALPVYERTLAEFERVLGTDHPDTLTSRGNLAHAYYMSRRQADAVALLEQTLADCQRVLGPDHPLTKTIMENLDIASTLPIEGGSPLRAV